MSTPAFKTHHYNLWSRDGLRSHSRVKRQVAENSCSCCWSPTGVDNSHPWPHVLWSTWWYGADHLKVMWYLLFVLHWDQSLSSFPSTVSSSIALLSLEYPSLFAVTISTSLSLPPSLFLLLKIKTHTHSFTGPKSGRAAAKGLTNAGWREVTALCITPWHWQLTDGYHSHAHTAGRGRGGKREQEGGRKEYDSPVLFSFHEAVLRLNVG